MSDDYARATGAGSFITIDGKEYHVSKFTPRDIGDLQAWLKGEIPDPRLEARKMIEGLPDAVAIEIWRTMASEAKNWPPTLADERGRDLLVSSAEGNARVLWVALRKYNRVDLAKARELADVIDMEQIGKVITMGFPESTDVPKV